MSAFACELCASRSIRTGTRAALNAESAALRYLGLRPSPQQPITMETVTLPLHSGFAGHGHPGTHFLKIPL